MSRWDSYPKPRVFKIGDTWGAVLVRGFEGNYEHDWVRCDTWREAFDWAYEQVKGWRRG